MFLLTPFLSRNVNDQDALSTWQLRMTGLEPPHVETKNFLSWNAQNNFSDDSQRHGVALTGNGGLEKSSSTIGLEGTVPMYCRRPCTIVPVSMYWDGPGKPWGVGKIAHGGTKLPNLAFERGAWNAFQKITCICLRSTRNKMNRKKLY